MRMGGGAPNLIKCGVCGMLGDEKNFSKTQLSGKKRSGTSKCKSCIEQGKLTKTKELLQTLVQEIGTSLLTEEVLENFKSKDDGYRLGPLATKMKGVIARLERDEEGKLNLLPLLITTALITVG